MQGRPLDERELLDAESVAGHLVEAGTVFALLAVHRRVLFPIELFADLFPSTRGRPSVPADIAASILVLQALHGLSDREAIAAVRTDLRWKLACGLPVGHAGFDASTLTYWRRRLAASNRPNRIFEAVRAVVAETGVIRGKTRQALDSTVLDDAVATQDTVTQLIAVIRKVRREVPGADVVVAQRRTAGDYDDPGKPQIAWDDAEARAVLVDALVRDALALLEVVSTFELDEAAAQPVALLALIAGQDVEPVEGSDGTDGRWRIAGNVAADRVISVVDPDARHAHKTVSRKQDGFKAHLAVEPDTGIVTACELTKATGAEAADGTVGTVLLERDETITEPVEVLGDSAYGTGDALNTLDRAGHLPLVKPWPTKAHCSRRVRHRRLHRRRADRHRHLPERHRRVDHAEAVGDVRRHLPRLPATPSMHHRQGRPHAAPARARRLAARPPPPRRGPAVAGDLPPAPAHGRTLPRLAGRRRQPQGPLPRRHQERRLAAHPHRRPQPAAAAQPRPDPTRRSLGAGLRRRREPTNGPLPGLSLRLTALARIRQPHKREVTSGRPSPGPTIRSPTAPRRPAPKACSSAVS